ncbi:MAG: GNAT family N-acetyltransferase [Bacteroidota bacterium]
MPITIRPATMADSGCIAEFNAMMAKETENLELDPIRLHAGVEALFQDPSRGLYYIAETDGKVVGQLMLTYEWSDWRNGTFWWIQSVYVEKEFRGKGVFRMLYRHIESLARSRNDVCGLRLYVEHHNAAARETYERLGMKKTHYEMYEIDFVM